MNFITTLDKVLSMMIKQNNVQPVYSANGSYILEHNNGI